MDFKYIFFDLDGTLTDPGPGITNSVMYALDKFGIHDKRENLYRFIGPPLVDSFIEFYGFSEEDSRKAVDYYREYFSDKGLFENRVYDGMPQVLEKLLKSGLHLLVATSKPAYFANKTLSHFCIDGFFDYVSGADLDGNKNAKSDIIKEALEVSRAPLEQVLMIGDRRHDIEGAKANNVMSAGVLYGYGDRPELEAAGADFIIETVEDILRFAIG